MNEEEPKPSRLERLKPLLPYVGAGVALGVYLGWKIKPQTVEVTQLAAQLDLDDILDTDVGIIIRDSLKKPLLEDGYVQFTLDTGELIGMVNFAHEKYDKPILV